MSGDKTTASRLILLLAEDDGDDMLLIRRAVKRLAAVERLVTVSAGEEVLAYLEGDNRYGDRETYPFPTVVVLDQFMPRWSGLDVLLWMRNSPRFEHLPVVILSLGLSPAQAETARLLKAACCPKTPQLDGLLEALMTAVDLVNDGWTPPQGVRELIGISQS